MYRGSAGATRENPPVPGPLPPFRPSPWLPGAHAQTLAGSLLRGRAVPLRRETLSTPDGDELHVDHLDAPAGAPRLLVLHGLEGSSLSPSVQGLLRHARAHGLSAAVLNFRYCARDLWRPRRRIPNRRPRLYHSGETQDLAFVAETLASREPSVPLLAAGVSLGGNSLLKWLGERPGQTAIRAAAAISVPFDLAAGARHLETPMGRLYVRAFLRTLVPKSEDLARRFPEEGARLDLPRARRAATFFEFDDAATAPLHGFAGAEDYWARCSSIGFLGAIRVPVLCLSAEDDPFLPAEALARAVSAASPAVRVVTSRRGGHGGFVAGASPLSLSRWADETAVAWLADRARRL